MKRSEKLLATVLLVSVGAFVIIPWIWQAFRGPVAAQETALQKATEKLDKAVGQFDIARASVQSMTLFKEQSLSSNSAQGALAYQQWLTDLAEIVADFKDAEVTPERISPSRDNSYVAVRLRVTGEGTIEQLRTFLYRFHRANVLHRISSMVAEAQNNSSRPQLTIRITTEAIALRDAEEKGPTLFPRTTIASVSDDDGPTKLELTSVEDFPEEAPFELRIGQNYYIVADIDGNELLLELEEGQDVEAAAEDIVELSVIHADFKDIAITEYDTLIEKNPFAKPAPYRPRLDLIGSKSVGRGEKMSLSAKVSGADTTEGEVDFELLSELTDGMTFEAGKLNWEPPTELVAGEVTVKVRAAGGGLREPIEAEFKLNLTDVNKPPVITIPEELVATLGKPFTAKLEATDPETPVEELKFALADGAPEGAAINAETKELTFTPPAEGEPGEVTINVTVTDAGTPAQTVTAAFKVTVQDDKAQFTFMEGVVAADSVPEAWLRDKSTNTKMILHEGDDLKYAGFDAVVLTIGDDFLLMQQADETIRLDVGQNLR
ncbi:MAG: putative Ig domain-containing protein, partial [Planctomycetales bacterium]